MPHTKSWAKSTKKDKRGSSGLSFLGRSEAKNQNNAIVVTVWLQSFGTRLRAVDLTHFNGIDQRPF